MTQCSRPSFHCRRSFMTAELYISVCILKCAWKWQTFVSDRLLGEYTSSWTKLPTSTPYIRRKDGPTRVGKCYLQVAIRPRLGLECSPAAKLKRASTGAKWTPWSRYLYATRYSYSTSRCIFSVPWPVLNPDTCQISPISVKWVFLIENWKVS